MENINLPVSEEKCLAAVRWMFKQPREIRLEFKKREVNKYFSLKSAMQSMLNEEISETATLASAFEFKVLLTNMKGVSAEDLAHIEKIGMVKKRRKRPKRKWYDDHKNIVKALGESGFSLREMVDYIMKKHKYKISHQSLGQFLKEDQGVK